MGKFGELGQHTSCGDCGRFNNLQTVVLDPAFTAKLKNFKPMQSAEKCTRVKFLSLPPWEQQFLGLRRGQCTNRIVLAYAKPSGKYLDFIADEKNKTCKLLID